MPSISLFFHLPAVATLLLCCLANGRHAAQAFVSTSPPSLGFAIDPRATNYVGSKLALGYANDSFQEMFSLEEGTIQSSPLGNVAGEPTTVSLYTGADGKSHFKDIPLTPEMKPFIDDEGAYGIATVSQACSGVIFRVWPVGYYHDWRSAPRRQYVVPLQGQVEIELPSGESRTFGPGQVLMAEDMAGMGHRTRVIGDTPLFYALMPITESEEGEIISFEDEEHETEPPLKRAPLFKTKNWRKTLTVLKARLPSRSR